MKFFSALTGFNREEGQLFAERCGFLASLASPQPLQQTFIRVVEVAGLPMISESNIGSINVPRLMELRQSDECRSFREWLSQVEESDDREISDRVNSLNARLGNVLHATPTKVVRFIATTGIGILLGIGPLLGIAAGALDNFLLEKLFPRNGPIAFLGKMYPSIFEKN